MPKSRHLRGPARSLRRRLTGPEQKLWLLVRGRRLANVKIRRQVPILNYIVDFASLEYKLVIEVDGDSHIGQAVADRRRQTELEQAGYRVLRVGNDDVLQDPESVLRAILQACGKLI